MIVDVSDARRSAKPWLPASDKDVSEGRVALKEYECGVYPACVKHGAMHALTKDCKSVAVFRMRCWL